MAKKNKIVGPLTLAKSLLFFFAFNAAVAAVPGQSIKYLENSYFGIIETDHDGAEDFVITDLVPLIEGQSYGWIIKLSPGLTTVKWKEVFELPEVPETWGVGEEHGEHEISQDRKVSVTEKEVFVQDGYIENFWSVATGDPPGEYIIRIYIENHLAKTFRFKVRPVSGTN